MVTRIDSIVRMSNHLQNQEQYQQRQLKKELLQIKQESVEAVDKELNKIDISI